MSQDFTITAGSNTPGAYGTGTGNGWSSDDFDPTNVLIQASFGSINPNPPDFNSSTGPFGDLMTISYYDGESPTKFTVATDIGGGTFQPYFFQVSFTNQFGAVETYLTADATFAVDTGSVSNTSWIWPAQSDPPFNPGDNYTISFDWAVPPFLVGLTNPTDAETALDQANMLLGTVFTVDDPSPAGTVLSSNPAPGTICDPGTSVDITISSGQVTVPDVTGLDQATAETTLTDAGLTIGSENFINDPTVPSGDVIDQDPAGGDQVDFGTPVDMDISIGPEQVTVPDVTGQSQADAESELVSNNLTVGSETSASDPSVPAGDVISQDPVGGTQVDLGSPVDLVISTGSGETINVYGKFVGSPVFKPVLFINAKGLKPRVYMPKENITVKT